MQIHPGARKHGVSDDDIRHALRSHVYVADVHGETSDAHLVLYIGPNRAANLLEIVVVERDDGSELVIHAMRLRPGYEQLLRRRNP